jgi:hypothetical protein
VTCRIAGIVRVHGSPPELPGLNLRAASRLGLGFNEVLSAVMIVMKILENRKGSGEDRR